MLADKSLLAGTLFVTFASGAIAGYTVHGTGDGAAPRAPTVESVCAPELEKLRRRGYDEAELAEARQAYTKYFSGYESFWNQFCDAYRSNLDTFETTLEKHLASIEERFRARTGAK